MKSSFTKIFIFVLLIGLLAACGSNNKSEDNGNAKDTSDQKVLKMATSADYPPFESLDKDGNFVGFDIALANTIADKLGYKLEIKDMKFDGLVASLQTKRVDMVMAGMTTTKKRKKNVDFSTEYHHTGSMFVTNKDSEIKSLEDLEGKTVGVQLGTIQEEGADKLSKKYGFKVKKVDEANLLIQELKSNHIEVAFMDQTVAAGYVDKQDLGGFDDPTSSSPGMAIAFPKDSDLKAKVDDVLKELDENGELQKLKDKWLEEEQ